MNLGILATILFNFKQYLKVIGKIIKAKYTGKNVVAIYFGHYDQKQRYKNFEKIINLLEESNKYITFTFITDFNLAKELSKKNNIYYFKYFFHPRVIYADIYLTSTQLTTPIGPFFSKKVQFDHNQDGIDLSNCANFDEYDYIFCSGKQQINNCKKFLSHRKLKNRCLIPGGYLKLDRLIKKDIKKDNAFIIYAPTVASDNNSNNSKNQNGIYDISSLRSLQTSGLKIIKSLIDAGYKVIFRPHPSNLKSKNVKKILDIFGKHPQLFFDDSKNYFETYQNSALMISDISATLFTYAYVFERPSIIFCPEISELGIDVEKISKITYSFGNYCQTLVYTIDELIIKVKDILENPEEYKQKVINYRKENLFNYGCSSEYLVNNLDYILNDKKHPDWEYI